MRLVERKLPNDGFRGWCPPTGGPPSGAADTFTDVAGEKYELPGHLVLGWEYMCVCPLWADGVEDTDDPAYLEGVLGLSRRLIGDIYAWSGRAEALLDGDGTTFVHDLPMPEWDRQMDDLDERAEVLVERLREELPPGITVSYHSWGR